MTQDLLIGMLIGLGIGVIICMIWQTVNNSNLVKTMAKIKEEEERRDPANWWKYNGDPFLDSYDDNDD